MLRETAARRVELEREARDIFSSIREKKKELIRVRFRQGRLVHRVAEQAGYGSNEITKLSEKTGISDSTLYEAKQFYELPQFGQSLGRLNVWLENEEQRKGRVTWSYCRNVLRSRLDGRVEPRRVIERRTSSLERKARRLEEEAEAFERELQLMEEQDEEAIGVAHQARRVARDARRQADRLPEPKKRRIVDANYLAFLRTQPCCVCGRRPAEPHHLIPVGRGGPDYSAVPLNREMHREAQGRLELFEQEYGVNLWRECNLHLIKYIARYEAE